MAAGYIPTPLTKDNSLTVLKATGTTNSSTISMSIPNIGAYPILFIYEGGKWNDSPIYAAIGLVRYYESAPQWNNVILLTNSGQVSSATVSNDGILTINLISDVSYNRLKLLSQ